MDSSTAECCSFVDGSRSSSSSRRPRFQAPRLGQEKGRGKQREQVPPGEKVMRMVATASSSPVAQYIAKPITALHTLDPRVKQGGDAGLAFGPGYCAFPGSCQYSFRAGGISAPGYCLQSSSKNMAGSAWSDGIPVWAALCVHISRNRRSTSCGSHAHSTFVI